MLLCDPFQRSKFSDPGVGKDHIDSPLRLDRLVETIEVGQLAMSLWTPVTLLPIPFTASSSSFWRLARDEDISTLFHEKLCRGEPYPGRTTSNHCYFPLQLLSFGHRQFLCR